jgi:hypothetical protein
MLFLTSYLLYFYTATCRNMRAVPNTVLFCSSLVLCFPGTLLRYFLNELQTVPVVPTISGVTLVFTFHMRCVSIVSSSYFRVFWLCCCRYYITIIIIIIIITTIIMHCRQGQESFLFSKTSGPVFGAQPASYSMGTGGPFPVSGAAVRWDHSPPSSHEVRNLSSFTSATPVCLHAVYRDNFAFYHHATLITAYVQQGRRQGNSRNKHSTTKSTLNRIW